MGLSTNKSFITTGPGINIKMSSGLKVGGALSVKSSLKYGSVLGSSRKKNNHVKA